MLLLRMRAMQAMQVETAKRLAAAQQAAAQQAAKAAKAAAEEVGRISIALPRRRRAVLLHAAHWHCNLCIR